MPLNEGAHRVLDYFSPGIVDGPVFADPIGGYFTRGACKRPLWNLCKAAGLNRIIGWHVLRHTFASHLAMKGVPIITIKDLLGHADIKMTMRYAHLSPNVKDEAVKLLDGLARQLAEPQGPFRDRSSQEVALLPAKEGGGAGNRNWFQQTEQSTENTEKTAAKLSLVGARSITAESRTNPHSAIESGTVSGTAWWLSLPDGITPEDVEADLAEKVGEP